MDHNQIQPYPTDSSPQLRDQENPSPPHPAAVEAHQSKTNVGNTPLGVHRITPKRGETLDDERLRTKDIIYKTYKEYADAEDQEMIGRWTETLNILLTFAGLQSAVVTAFILALYPDLKPDPADATNRLLEQILHRLDNSTTLSVNACTSVDDCRAWAVPRISVVVLAWWHVSLACSLLSAFGTLLCKQWVMHYHSQDPSVNTGIRKAQLREARYQGLRSWGFFGIFESLSILLQLSLLFFSIGLVIYLKPTSSGLFIVTTIPIGVAAVFYGVTSITGAMYATCPFKSPITDFAFKVGSNVVWWSRIAWVTVRGPLVIALRWVLRSQVDSKGIVKGIKDAWSHSLRMHVGYWFQKAFHGDKSIGVGEDSIGAAGVLFWWLCQEDRRAENNHQLNTTAVIDTFVTLDPNMLHRLQKTEIFDYWTNTVIWKLFSVTSDSHHTATTTRTQNFDIAQLTDALCHFMHHSPRAAQIAMNAVPDNIDRKFWYFCHAIRKIWGDPDMGGLLPVATMRWSTVAVYVRAQLSDWCSKTNTKDNRRYRSEILQELPVVLHDPRLEDRLPDVANIVSLAAVALVEDLPGVIPGVLAGLVGAVDGVLPSFTQAVTMAVADGVVPDFQSREGLVSSDPLNQLLLALHRLSHYQPLKASATGTDQADFSIDSFAAEFLPQLINASKVSLAGELSELVASRLIVPNAATTKDTSKWGKWRVARWNSHKSKLVRSKLVACSAWQEGQVGDALLWLFDIGISYRDREHTQQHAPTDPTGALVRELHALVMVLCEHYSSAVPTDEDLYGLLALSTPAGLATVLGGYAGRNVVLPSSLDSLNVLDHALGLRYYNPPPLSGSVLSRAHSNVYKYARNAHHPFLNDNPYILHQLIRDVQAYGSSKEIDKPTMSTRLLLLSVLVKGRDIFFPHNLAMHYEDLARELSLISTEMFDSGNFFGWKAEVLTALLAFRRWEELLLALELSQSLLVQKTSGDEVQSPLQSPTF